MIRCGDEGKQIDIEIIGEITAVTDGTKSRKQCSSKRQETMKSTHPGAFYVCASMELIIFKVVI